MVKLDLKQVLETTDAVVREMLATGEFGQSTFKDVLFRVDGRLDLPRGTLIQYEHKGSVKERIKELLDQAEVSGGQTPSPPKKRTAQPESSASTKPNKRRKKETAPSGSDTEPEPQKAKKPRPASKAKNKGAKADKATENELKKSNVKGKASGQKPPKPAISAETVDSELDDSDPEPSTSKLPTSKPSVSKPSPSKPPTATSSPKKSKQKQKAAESDDDDKESSPQVKKPRQSPRRPKVEPTQKAKKVSGDKSESEVSVLLDDEPPKRGRKSKGEKSETKPKRTRQKKEKKELSKDEETIKRLKSLVVACGVRKVWTKEFKDLDEPSAQIKRLKSILTELGMSGRMSLEQAKAIKEKREFAQELEDIKEFGLKVAGRSEGRSSRKKIGDGEKDAESSDEDESDDDKDDGPPKKRITARNSINAFLQDQSDED